MISNKQTIHEIALTSTRRRTTWLVSPIPIHDLWNLSWNSPEFFPRFQWGKWKIWCKYYSALVPFRSLIILSWGVNVDCDKQRSRITPYIIAVYWLCSVVQTFGPGNNFFSWYLVNCDLRAGEERFSYFDNLTSIDFFNLKYKKGRSGGIWI